MDSKLNTKDYCVRPKLHAKEDRLTTSGGFGLVEMMVAVALFVVVMTISVGALLSLIDANRKVQALRSVMNNLNFALENMSRNIRVGTTYHCHTQATPPPNLDTPKDCTEGGVLLAFEANDGDPSTPIDQVIYRLSGTQLERSIDGGATFIGVTAPEVRIENMKFYVSGTSVTDTKQPKVTITIQGLAGVKARVKTDFNLQVTISQRLPDL